MKLVLEYLIFIILEFGGKSFCIILKDVNIDFIVKRFIWGKLINVG